MNKNIPTLRSTTEVYIPDQVSRYQEICMRVHDLAYIVSNTYPNPPVEILKFDSEKSRLYQLHVSVGATTLRTNDNGINEKIIEGVLNLSYNDNCQIKPPRKKRDNQKVRRLVTGEEVILNKTGTLNCVTYWMVKPDKAMIWFQYDIEKEPGFFRSDDGFRDEILIYTTFEAGKVIGLKSSLSTRSGVEPIEVTDMDHYRCETIVDTLTPWVHEAITFKVDEITEKSSVARIASKKLVKLVS